jgi:hypothetical protein
MTPRARTIVIAAAVTAAGLVVWRIADRTGEHAAPDIEAEAATSADPELERLRAEIEAERAAERARAAEAERGTPRGPRSSLLATGESFSHARHRELPCLDCHSSADTHGAVTVADTRQCMGCHHAQPLAADCTRCHQNADFQGERRRIAHTFDLTVGEPVTRQLVFAHVQHREAACISCHVERLTLAATVTCTDCHEEHHRPGAQCMQCHTAPPRASHTVAAHLGCTAAGCHDPAPVAGVPRTRTFCLVCHQEMVDHESGLNCADCHTLPPPRRANSAATTSAEGRST